MNEEQEINQVGKTWNPLHRSSIDIIRIQENKEFMDKKEYFQRLKTKTFKKF